MELLTIAKLYARLTSAQYPCIAVEVKDGQAIDHTNNKLLLVEHLAYQQVPPDGVYYATEATCGGGNKSGCSIGSPQPECIGSCYSPQKCAVYYLTKVDETTKVHTDMGTLATLYEEWYELGNLGEPL